MDSDILERVFAAWDASGDLHKRAVGVSDEDIAEAERRLGRQLPEQTRALYRAHDGAYLLEGNLTIHPLLLPDDDALALATASGLLRSWEWPVAGEVVVQVGETSDERSLAVGRHVSRALPPRLDRQLPLPV